MKEPLRKTMSTSNSMPSAPNSGTQIQKSLAANHSISQFSQYLSERRLHLQNFLLPLAKSYSLGTFFLTSYVYLANSYGSPSNRTSPFYPLFRAMYDLVTQHYGTHPQHRLYGISALAGFTLIPLSLLWAYVMYERSHCYGDAPKRISIEARKILQLENKIFLRNYGFDEYLESGLSDYERSFVDTVEDINDDPWCRDEKCRL